VLYSANGSPIYISTYIWSYFKPFRNSLSCCIFIPFSWYTSNNLFYLYI